jgi:transposase InsO family protein
MATHHWHVMAVRSLGIVPKAHVIQTDNGAEFQSQFHWHAESLDIRHVYIRPRTPRLNGKVERSHRVDNQEFYQLLDRHGISDDIHLFNQKLREWRITTITIVHTGHLRGGPRSNDLWQKLELMCHRGHETLHDRIGGQGRNRTTHVSGGSYPAIFRHYSQPSHRWLERR